MKYLYIIDTSLMLSRLISALRSLSANLPLCFLFMNKTMLNAARLRSQSADLSQSLLWHALKTEEFVLDRIICLVLWDKLSYWVNSTLAVKDSRCTLCESRHQIINKKVDNSVKLPVLVRLNVFIILFQHVESL